MKVSRVASQNKFISRFQVEPMPMITTKNMPEWLRSFVYDDLGGSYDPDRIEFQNNLESDEIKNLRYLGTYFPRSYTESYCIFRNLFENDAYQSLVKDKQSLTILTFGCGTGGDLMGLIEAIEENLPWINDLTIVAYDGNFIAIDILRQIVTRPEIKGRFSLNVDYAPVPMREPKDFNLYCNCIKQNFDLIVSMKMVNELYRKDILTTQPYKAFMEVLARKLDNNGVLLVLDVPIKVKEKNVPLLLTTGLRSFLRDNPDFSAIVPIPCHKQGTKCNNRCYLTKTFHGEIFTSEKVTYSLIARIDMANTITPAMRNAFYLINGDGEVCQMSGGKEYADSFTI